MPTPLLLLAHPGHELRLFGWMEQERPLVCILTDGSGSVAPPRTALSLALLAACGAQAGPVLGWLPDRAWYAALLAGDATPFLAAADSIAAATPAGTLVVADPVEGYNPMHDLAAAVADRVALLVGGRRATYPLMQPQPGPGGLALDRAAQQRKLAAIAAYAPLAQEAAALLRADPAALAQEKVVPHRHDWPAQPARRPEYESIGAGRSAAGVYARTITYAEHVRPMALRLRAPLAMRATA